MTSCGLVWLPRGENHGTNSTACGRSDTVFTAMALLLLPLHTSLALLLPLPTQLPPVRRCPSPQCQATAISELGAALHQSLSAAPSSPAEANGSWLRLATLLCDGVYELAAEAAAEADADADSAEPPSEEALVEARELCSGLLERLAAEAPALYAVAKFSAKRNEALGSRRGVERCLAELGLLLGTSAALTPEEVEPLLATLRPVTRTAASSRRVAAYLVLCRGFSSPGAGKSGGWRKGSGTVQQLLREAPRPPSLESQLEARNPNPNPDPDPNPNPSPNPNPNPNPNPTPNQVIVGIHPWLGLGLGLGSG